MKLLIFVSLTKAFALDIMEIDQRFDTPDKIYKSNFQIKLALEANPYDIEANFSGRKIFAPKTRWLLGPRIAAGYELYLGGGLSTTTKMSYLYSQRQKEEYTEAAVDLPVIISATLSKSTLRAYDVAQSLNFMFEAGPLYFQPFVEAGIGRGSAISNLDYRFEDFTNDNESYLRSVEDRFTSLHFSLGLNIVGKSGMFGFFKLTQMNYLVESRTNNEKTVLADTIVSDRLEQEESLRLSQLNYALGMGYRF